MRRVLSFLVLAVLSGASYAEYKSCALAVPNVSVDFSTTQFMVSGVLRKEASQIEIKLIHSLLDAKTENEALEVFMRNALNDYPGYSMVSTLVSPVATNKAQCGLFT